MSPCKEASSNLVPRELGLDTNKQVSSSHLAALSIVLATVLILSLTAFLRDDHAIDRLLLFGLPGPFETTIYAGPAWLGRLSWALTTLGSPKGIAALSSAVLLGLVLARRFEAALYLFISVATGAAFGFVVKRLIATVRPHGPSALGADFVTSFPSGHALLAALLAASLVLIILRSWRGRTPRAAGITCTALLWLGVSLSRVHLGLHWPTDVIAGSVIGAGWAIAVNAAWFWLRAPRYFAAFGGSGERNGRMAK